MKAARQLKTLADLTYGLPVLFLLIMLVPNLILGYTEPYSVTTLLASILLPAAFYLLWSILLPSTGKMVLYAFPLMLLGAFQVVISYLFGNSIIAVDMFTNLFTTSSSEAGELLASIYPAVIMVCLLYIPLLVLAILYLKNRYKMAPPLRIRLAKTALLLAITGMLAAFLSHNRNPEFAARYHIFPVNVCHNIRLATQRWTQSKNYFNTSAHFRFNAEKEFTEEEREIYLLVIGEASRAASWSLFGYERETTPDLSVTAGIVPFTDMLTQSNTTHKSVPIMLSPSSAEDYNNLYQRKSMISMFNEAGFKTHFISNQPPNRSLTEFFATEACESVNLTDKDAGYSDHPYDGEMIPILEQLLTATNDHLFIVVHMYGSHANHSKRYPRDFSRYQPDEVPSISPKYRSRIGNAYDNSILYTDHVLSEIIGLLEQSDSRSALLFCSDHGEDLLDDSRERFLHASPTPTYYQLHVAAFGWFSEKYQEKYPDKVLSARKNRAAAETTACLFHTLGEIAAIKCDYIDSARSLVSPMWKAAPRMYINDYNQAIPVVESGLTREDFRMFDLQHIRYDRKEGKRKRH